MDFFNRKKGFTLVELLISIALMALIVALAAPSFQMLFHKNRISFETERVFDALYYIRTEAIKRNSQVSLCPSSDGLVCDPGLSWMAGWIIFSDQAKRGELDHDSDIVLRVERPVATGYVLYSTKHQDWFGYRSNGTSVGSSGSGNTSFVICSPEAGVDGKRVIVSLTGRPRVAKGIGDRTCEGS